MDISDRMTLPEKVQKILSLGLWSPDIAQPDPQILERIQRLNQDIEKQIYKLYLPDDQEQAIAKIENQYLSELQAKNQRRDSQQASQSKQGTDWNEYRENNFTHLGNGVSTWLNDKDEQTGKLEKIGLPLLPSADSVADFFDKSIKQIKWFAYHREYSDYINYNDFELPKLTGGYRSISKPKLPLAEIQEKIKTEILDKIHFPSYVHGFVKKHSIYQNAREHAKSEIIINIDVKDFFENCTFKKVRMVFSQLGYSGETATVLALLTTKQTYRKVEFEGNILWECSEKRYLPQGACTSPGISNLIARKIDLELYERSRDLGFIYTRYADDLTFSTKKAKENIETILYMARYTLEIHGFEANPKKTKVLYENHQQNVTGLVVNSGTPKVPRKWRKKLRAAVHQFQYIEDDEVMRQEYERIKGSIEFLKLSHPQKAVAYKRKIDRYMKSSIGNN